MPGGDVRVESIAAGDWQLARKLRLASLLDAPDAFCARHADEADEPDAMWQRRTESNALQQDTAGFFAYIDDEALGLAVCVRQPGEVELNAVWVDPRARGRGVGRALVAAAQRWARGLSAQRMTLGVNADNAVAIGLYTDCGFTQGARSAMPGRPEITLIHMECGLGPP